MMRSAALLLLCYAPLRAPANTSSCSISPKVYYLTMDINGTRSNKLQRDFQDHGWSALAFVKDKAAEDQELDQEGAMQQLTRHVWYNMSRTEVSIVRGHKAIWHQIVKDQEPAAIVLEDDASFKLRTDQSKCPSELMERVAAVDPDWDVLFLHKNHIDDHLWFMRASGNFGVYRMYSTTAVSNGLLKLQENVKFPGHVPTNDSLIERAGVVLEAVSYMVSKKGAQQLITLFDTLYAQLDDQIAMASPLMPESFIDPATGQATKVPVKLNMYLVKPSMITQFDSVKHPWQTLKTQVLSNSANQISPSNHFGWRPKPCWVADGYNCNHNPKGISTQKEE